MAVSMAWSGQVGLRHGLAAHGGVSPGEDIAEGRAGGTASCRRVSLCPPAIDRRAI